MMTTQVDERPTAQRVPVRIDVKVGAIAVVVAVAVWSAWTGIAGLDLVVRGGRTVGLASVLATTLVVSALGVSLLRLLEARTVNGLRTWTVVAASVLAVSLSGPLGATTLAAGLALVSLHLWVAAVLVVGLRRVRRNCGGAA